MDMRLDVESDGCEDAAALKEMIENLQHEIVTMEGHMLAVKKEAYQSTL